MKFGFNRPVVLEEKMSENVDIQHKHTYTHTYTQMDDRGLPTL